MQLKRQVFEANLALTGNGLVVLTWGNASGIDREKGIVVIKPSGVEYGAMSAESMVAVDLASGRTIGDGLKPSSDTPTHLEMYRAFPNIGGIVHTHSRWATVFAQSKRGIPPLGTTHADYFHGAIPCTRLMTAGELNGDYELETGKLIAETCKNPDEIPAVLVAGHGPFVWGGNAGEAARNAVVLEEVAFMAWHNLSLDANIETLQRELLDRHYTRKHGPGAYYGQ